MPNFNPITVVTGATINPAAILQNLEAIAAAHNTHETGDFPADCVPLSAIINDHSVFPVTFGIQGTLTGPILANVQHSCLVIPNDCTLIAVSVVASAIDANGNGGDVNIYHETDATDVLSADITVDDVLVEFKGTINKTDFSAGDILTIRAAIDGVQPDLITGLNFTLWFKAAHTT